MAFRPSPLLVAVTLAGCSNAPSTPAPDAGDPLGGKSLMEACMELCLLRPVLCGEGGEQAEDCASFCPTQVLDAEPCERQAGALYACQMDFLLSQGCNPYWPPPCFPAL